MAFAFQNVNGTFDYEIHVDFQKVSAPIQNRAAPQAYVWDRYLMGGRRDTGCGDMDELLFFPDFLSGHQIAQLNITYQ